MKSPTRRASVRSALLWVGLVAASPAVAAPRVMAAAGCAPVPGDGEVEPARLSGDGDLALADGRMLRVAGVDMARATASTPDLPARAGVALAAWAAGRPVTLHTLAPAPDRWGRVPALLFGAAEADAPPASAAEALVRDGMARVRPEPAVHACLPALLAAEADARAAKRGLWADPAYAVLAPADAEGLAAQAGGLALVEGTLHLHETRGALYLALGRDRRGFAAVVSRRDAARFAKAGLDLHDYEGTPVRLRGDLDARFGPRMRVTDPDAVESLEPGSLPEEPDAKHWTARARPR